MKENIIKGFSAVCKESQTQVRIVVEDCTGKITREVRAAVQTVGVQWRHGVTTGPVERRCNRTRDRQAAVIERLSEYRRTRLPAAGREAEGSQSRGLTFVSRLSPDLGLAMPLAEATRLLTQGWEAGQVREADQFVRELEGEGPAVVDGEGYDPAQPTESREGEEGE